MPLVQQVHVAVLLGAAGSFGEAAAQLTQGWFNSLTYVWERQVRAAPHTNPWQVYLT